MLHEAPQVLIALEQSGLAAAIRQSVWAYPAANVGHIVALTLFAGSVVSRTKTGKPHEHLSGPTHPNRRRGNSGRTRALK